jgi:hypothetical protein
VASAEETETMAKGHKTPPAFTPVHERGRTEDEASHIAFIAAHAMTLFPVARAAYEQEGRGAFVSNTQDSGADGTEAKYITDQRARAIGAGWPNKDTDAMIQDYDPEHEFILIIIGRDGGESAYRVRMIDGKPVLSI